ncbi:ubiquitinyl hydrolase [Aureococcus anophagefferens]|nr:ubiquitinyl hydrolase [Aureococcus anophagefferens]
MMLRLVVVTLSLAAASEVVLGPFGPVSGGADGKLLARLRKDSLGPPAAAASAQINRPTGLLVHGDRVFASEFQRNRVLVARTARAAAARPEGSGAWTVFADAGPHCATDRRTRVLSCARLDGAWGLAVHEDLLYVSSFGSDEILAFHRKSRKFKRSLTGDLDSPEGLAVGGDFLYVASFLDSRLVAFDLKRGGHRTLALGAPVEVDFEALAFVPGRSPFDEAATLARRRAALWGPGEPRETAAPFVDRLRGPEQLALLGNASLAVSSLHDESVLEIDVEAGASRRPRTARDGRFAGPLGIAVAAPDGRVADAAGAGGCAAGRDPLLVAPYRSTATVLGDDCDGSLSLDDDLLRGPTAIALDPSDAGGVYVSAYETSAVLYFNLSHVDRDAEELLRRVSLAARLERAGYDNDTACLVNSRWLAHWRLWSSRDACGAPAPGAVDNACLLAGDGTLQGGLTWRVHYDAVPEAAWRLLARAAAAAPPPPRPDAAAEAAAAAKLRGSAATASSTGLANLGNTCYFNASLQCLSRAAPLSRHFLSDGFAADVNEANPMGCGGRVAREYAAALKVAFHRGDRVHSPHALLRSIVRHNADFEGRRQHDAHELLTTLLDGLHEDLNRVRGKKPYFETPESTGPRDDARVAAATWAQHRRRNDSVVVDALHGLLRSTLECPVCGFVSTHFDPFSTLELELADAPGHRSVDEDDDVDDELCADDSDDGVDVADGFVSLAEDGRGAVGAPGARLPGDRRTRALVRAAAAALGCPADRVEVVAVHALGERDVDSDDDLGFCCERPFAAGPPKSGSRFSRPVAVRDGDAVPLGGAWRLAAYARPPPEHRACVLVAEGDAGAPPSVVYYRPGGPGALAPPPPRRAARDFVLLDDAPALLRLHVAARPPPAPADGAAADDDDDGAPSSSSCWRRAENAVPRRRRARRRLRPAARAASARSARTRPAVAARRRARALAASRRRAAARDAARETAGGAFAFAGGRWPGLGAAGRPLSLEGCLRRFTAPETLDADNPWRCGSCAAPRRAVKRIALWRAPEILVCCLKRFGGRGKLDGDVDFPLDGLDLAPYVAHGGPGPVTNHFGASFGGHYTAFARDDDGGWLKCDDSAVSPVPAAVVKSRAAYVLFYKRRATS